MGKVNDNMEKLQAVMCGIIHSRVALASAAQEAIWIMELMRNLNGEGNGPMLIREDNQSAKCIAI